MSPNGDDANDGTKQRPFSSIEKALETARMQNLNGVRPTNIYLREGVYPVTDTISLSAADAGKPWAPLKISGYPGETARITGGADIPFSEFSPAAAGFTERILDPSARPNILQVDLKAYGITDYGELSRRGHFFSEKKPAQAELSIDGKKMQLAQWPNDNFVGYVSSPDEIPADGNRTKEDVLKGCSFVVDYDRPFQWAQPELAWLSGAMGENFAYDYFPLGGTDPKTKTVYLREGAIKKYYSKRFFRFENIPEELDAPGEYYIDRESGILYLYPPAGVQADSQVTLSMSENTLISLNGAADVVFENLILDGGRGSALVGKNTNRITVRGCTVQGFGADGIRLDNTEGSTIRDSAVYDIGKSGVAVSGGGYQTITSSYNEIVNNDIHDFSQLERSYTAGIYLGYQSVGINVLRNHVHHGPHAGMIYYGVNHNIQQNEFNDLVLEFHDMDAVYVNNSEFPWERGTAFRGNYFHDIGNQTFNGERQMNIAAIRSDNNGNGLIVEGNIFYHVGKGGTNAVSGVRAQGTRNRISGNLFVDCSETYNGNNTYIEGAAYNMAEEKNVRLKRQMDSYLPVYGRYFPELNTFWEEHPSSARTNVFENNVICHAEFPLSSINGAPDKEGFRSAPELVVASGNRVTGDKEIFKDYANQDFSFAEGASVPEGFPVIPFSAIGNIRN